MKWTVPIREPWSASRTQRRCDIYEYRGTITRVIDGDTVHARLDLGIDVRIDLVLRLYGINAPEMRTPEGVAAKAHLVDLLGDLSVPLTIRTIKDHKEKFGRYLATLIHEETDAHATIDVSARMVADGFAVVYLP